MKRLALVLVLSAALLWTASPAAAEELKRPSEGQWGTADLLLDLVVVRPALLALYVGGTFTYPLAALAEPLVKGEETPDSLRWKWATHHYVRAIERPLGPDSKHEPSPLPPPEAFEMNLHPAAREAPSVEGEPAR